MAIYKGVYFCESDPSKWFENMKDADRFDEVSEIESHIKGYLDESYKSDQDARLIAEHMLKRYEIKQRWDWKEPDGDVQE